MRRCIPARFRLRCEIFVSLIGVILTLAVLIGGLSIWALDRLSASTAKEEIQNSAQSVARLIEQSLVERRHDMELLAISSELRLAERDAVAAKIYLRRAQDISRHFALLGFVNSRGTMTVTSNGLAKGVDVSNRDYYVNGLSGIYIGDAHDAIHDAALLTQSLGAADRLPRFIELAAPVYRSGQAIGVVVAHLSTDWAQDIGMLIFQRLLSRYQFVEVKIHAADGSVIFSHSNLDNDDRHLLTGSALVHGIGTGGSLSWPVHIRTTASVRIPGASDTQWYFLLGTAGAALLATVAAWYIACLLARPIERLRREIVRNSAPLPQTGSQWTCREAEDIRAAVQLDARARCADRQMD